MKIKDFLLLILKAAVIAIQLIVAIGMIAVMIEGALLHWEIGVMLVILPLLMYKFFR
jgi:hypothetical protein